MAVKAWALNVLSKPQQQNKMHLKVVLRAQWTLWRILSSLLASALWRPLESRLMKQRSTFAGSASSRQNLISW